MPPKKVPSDQKIERDPYHNAEWYHLEDDAVACVFRALDYLDYRTAAALCLATPRQGLAAIKEHWKEDPAFAFAMRFHTHGVVPVELIEKYLNDPKADSKHFKWMNTCLSNCVVEVTEVTRDEGVQEDWSIIKVTKRQDWSIGKVTKPRLVRSRLVNGTLSYFSGPAGREYRVRQVTTDGRIAYFTGPRRRESLQRVERPDGVVLFFYGEQDQEVVVRTTSPDGSIRHYEGTRGHEYIVRRYYPPGHKRVSDYFDSTTRGLVRIDFICGNIAHFDPVPGAPVLERVVYPNNSVAHYEGPYEMERVVRVVTDAQTRFYDGDKDEERLVRIIDNATGALFVYNGEKGQEYKVSGMYADGLVVHYKGVKNKERKVRTVDVNGGMCFYKGARGDERKVRSVDVNGRTRLFESERRRTCGAFL